MEVGTSTKEQSGDCKIIRRRGRLYTINKRNPKLEQRQG